MFQDTITIDNINDLSKFDNVTKLGLYGCAVANDVYGTLIVYNSFGGSGGIIQEFFHVKNVNYRKVRIKTSNVENKWSEWK